MSKSPSKRSSSSSSTAEGDDEKALSLSLLLLLLLLLSVLLLSVLLLSMLPLPLSLMPLVTPCPRRCHHRGATVRWNRCPVSRPWLEEERRTRSSCGALISMERSVQQVVNSCSTEAPEYRLIHGVCL